MATATTDPYVYGGRHDYGRGATIQSSPSYPNTPSPKKKAFDESRLKRLGRAMQWSRLKLLPFRDQRTDFVRQYVGKWYGDEGQSHDRVPINFMEMVVDTYAQRLAARNPRFSVSTPIQELKASALDLETGLNYLVGKINLQRELKRVVKDATFLIGIMKVGICQGEYTTFDESSGEPFAKRVSLDDWAHDIFARDYEECSWCGNRYVLTLDQVRDNPSFDAKVRKTVQAQPRTSYNEQGDTKTSTLGPGFSDLQDADLYDTLPLWDVWLPRERLVVTVTADQSFAVTDTSKVLRVVEWQGPEHGPYHLLGWYSVPDNVMPLSLASLTFDVNSSFNVLFNKTIQQAKDQKQILGYRGSAADDASRIANTPDGGSVRMDDPTNVKEYNLRGPNDKVQALLIQLKQLASYNAGNLDLLAGLDPQSKTVGQDKLLAANAGGRMDEMEDTTVGFTSRIGRDLAWYLYTDPLIDIPLVKEIGAGVRIPFRLNQHGLFGGRQLSKADQDGQFLDYNFQVEPYSMQPKTPTDRLNTLMQFLQAMQPFAQLMQQQGSQLDFQAICRLFAKYTNMTELDDIMQFAAADGSHAMQDSPIGQPPPLKQAAVTRRENVRINRPGGTQGGQEGAMLAMLMGHGQQPSEAARMSQ